MSSVTAKTLTSTLVMLFSSRPELPSRNEVLAMARTIAASMGFDGSIDSVIEEALIAIYTRMGLGTSLVDTQAQHDSEWVEKRSIDWKYTSAYENYLREKGWAAPVVQRASDVSQKILGHLQDPTSEGTWDRRGLVIGHVQSGKTANYLALTARAADAGYKFIIIIAGIHNNLRRQTQERVDEGFVGRSSDAQKRTIGVGLTAGYPKPVTLTNVHQDFNSHAAAQSGWQINDFSKPIVLVIKKNVRTLDALHEWLSKLNAQAGRITDVPMLMIDDEADNASINTNKADIDPTRTNKCIRRILQLFDKSSYVGYTATPFANIFINHEAFDDEVYEELFPRDFIYSLDAPTSYFGPDRVFLEDSSSQFVRAITDAEEFLPQSHKKGDPVDALPPSLCEAIDSFFLAKAIRVTRGQGDHHCSMMINVSRFVNVQQAVQAHVSLYVRETDDAVMSSYALPSEQREKNPTIQRLRAVFEREYGDTGITWDRVVGVLPKATGPTKVLVINSKSDEVLDYAGYENDGGLTAIAIGGLTLSRGLTLEGLCVSYMYRNTKMYDTLMQMGRWFGYRPGYEDLCRVHLSPDSIRWYAHIAAASEELRQQIRIMRRDGLSPRDFGLYVRAHPDKLLITAPNKMQAAQRVTVKHNYSGRLLESYILEDDTAIAEANEALIKEYWELGFGGRSGKKTKKGWIFEDVDTATVIEFLEKFRLHGDLENLRGPAQTFLRQISSRHPHSDVLLISVANNGEDRSTMRLGAQMRNSAKPYPDKAGTAWRLSKDRVASRGDEGLGLSDTQELRAREIAAEDETRDGKPPSDVHLRAARDKPLLMIHVLSPVGDSNRRLPAIGVSFPCRDYDVAVEVVANLVWVERMFGPETDSADEEEDYDEETV